MPPHLPNGQLKIKLRRHRGIARVVKEIAVRPHEVVEHPLAITTPLLPLHPQLPQEPRYYLPRPKV